VSWFRELIYKNNLAQQQKFFSWTSSFVWFATCLFEPCCGFKGGVAASGWDGRRRLGPTFAMGVWADAGKKS